MNYTRSKTYKVRFYRQGTGLQEAEYNLEGDDRQGMGYRSAADRAIQRAASDGHPVDRFAYCTVFDYSTYAEYLFALVPPTPALPRVVQT